MTFSVDLPGLEPGIQEPESYVLPITPQVNVFLKSCPTRIRTWNGCTKNSCVAITPSDNTFPFGDAKICKFYEFQKK
jgi:hypothetical protein